MRDSPGLPTYISETAVRSRTSTSIIRWIHMRLPVTVGYPLPYPLVHHIHQRGTQSSDCPFHRREYNQHAIIMGAGYFGAEVYTLDSAQSAFASMVCETAIHTKKESATQGLTMMKTYADEKQALYDVFGAEVIKVEAGRS
ncbi:hypothetical protein EYR40_009291 [Pleurotus pulmonarius]|nr:hypothetical protein EYR40_009291 [Pleurotus pulmonarius]